MGNIAEKWQAAGEILETGDLPPQEGVVPDPDRTQDQFDRINQAQKRLDDLRDDSDSESDSESDS